MKHRDFVNITVDAIPLSVIYRHYRSIWVLIDHAKKSEGGQSAMVKWDIERSKEREFN